LLIADIAFHLVTSTSFKTIRANVTILRRANSGKIVQDAALCEHWPNISSIHLKEKMESERKQRYTMLKQDPRSIRDCSADTKLRRCVKSMIRPWIKPIRLAMVLVSTAASLASLPMTMRAQSPGPSENSDGAERNATLGQLDLTYVRPTQKTKLRNYVFDAYGPYPIVGSAVAAGFGQMSNSPPEWGQGAEGFGKRMGSDFGIAATGTTVRYGLAQAFKEDTLYYRCTCKGVLPRLSHAVLSTLTARRGEDGHRVFSVPALLAPYAGSFTAVYGWYPDRFGAKDAFRIGNYSLLAYMGGNIGLEFIYSGPHSLLSRMHLNNRHSAPTNDAHVGPANDPHAAPTEGMNQ
jgi:hypothetical protein